MSKHSQNVEADQMIPRKKLQVFVSSTYADLKEERQAAVEAILSARHIPAGMELFAAGDKSQMEVIKRWIEESDVFLLILGGRYGSIEPTSGKSYIQLEYEYAQELGKPFFAVVINEDHLEEKVKQYGSMMLEKDHRQTLREFREVVKRKLVRFFGDPRDIKLAVHETLSELSKREDLIGWIPGDQAVNSGAVAKQLAFLVRENELLRKHLEAAEDTSNQQHFQSLERSFQALERRVGEVISNERLDEFNPYFPPGALANDARLTRSELSALREDEFLARMVQVLQPFNIPLADRFRLPDNEPAVIVYIEPE